MRLTCCAKDADTGSVMLQRMLSSLAYTTQIVDVREAEQEVDVALTLGAQVFRLRFSKPNENKAFARTRSFAIAHLDPLPSRAHVEHVVGFVRALARIDPGGVQLVDGPRKQLPVLGTIPGGAWSQATFDANVEALRVRGARFGAAVMVVTQACEMACTFCPSKDKQHEVVADGGADRHLADLVHQLGAGRSLGAHSVDLGGNDVLRFPRLFPLLEAAHRLGYTDITAQSPGLVLADRAFAEHVATSALDAIDVPIYGIDAAGHDAITGTPGSFEKLIAALDQVLALGRPRIRLRTLALHNDLLQLDALIAFASRRFGLEVGITSLRPNRVGEREHLKLAAGYAELAAIAARHPARFEIDGPLCLLPPVHAEALARRIETRGGRVHLWDLGIRDDSEDAAMRRERERGYLPHCETCRLRAACAGVLTSDLERFAQARLSL